MGSHFASRTGGTTSVWLPVSAARGDAASGNSERAINAIRAAEAAWEHVEPDEVDDLGGICTFSQPRTLYYAADALAWLPGEADNAVDFSTRAVDAYSDPTDPAWAFGDQAGSHSDLAIARVAARDLEGANEALAPVLDLPPEQRINGIVHSVQRVHQALTRSGLAAAASDMIEHIEDSHTPLGVDVARKGSAMVPGLRPTLAALLQAWLWHASKKTPLQPAPRRADHRKQGRGFSLPPEQVHPGARRRLAVATSSRSSAVPATPR